MAVDDSAVGRNGGDSAACLLITFQGLGFRVLSLYNLSGFRV